ncbi:MAG: hypothetical protein V4690_01540 [Patescibacteria group bacterium]
MVTVLFFPKFETWDYPHRVCAEYDQSPNAINKFSRKFIVLNNESKALSTDFAVVVGPVHHDDERLYQHSDLKCAVESKLGVLGLGGNVEGGGILTFNLLRKSPTGPVVWTATMHKKSTEFGPYNPSLLLPENRKCIVESLRMSVIFEWVHEEHLSKT